MRNGRLRQGRWGAAEFTATIIAPIQRGAWGWEAAREGEGGFSEEQVRPPCSQQPHSNTFGSLAEQSNKFPRYA